MELRRYSFAAGLALTLAFAPPAAAQTVSYLNQCATGSLAACWSISISTTAAFGGGTDVLVSVTNWQGTPGYTAAPNVLETINIWTAPGTGTGNSFVQNADLTGSTATNVGGAAGWTATQDGFQGIRLSTATALGGLAGCTAPASVGGNPIPVTSYWSTCGSSALVMRFNIPTVWSVPVGVPVTLSAGGVNGLGSRCDLGVNNPAFTPGRSDPCGPITPPPPPPTSVPEPEGWLLMASGLFGLAFVRLRRKDAQAS
ncbi:MAG: hypothetical protein ABL963_17220 [Longimicrobiales bacterium]